MKELRLQMLLVLVSALAMATVWVAAQQTPRPMLANYFTEFASTLPSAGYAPLAINETVTEDLDGDGNQDLVVLGANYPGGTVVNVPQPGRVFLGDGNGRFTAAPTDLFPVDTLMTVHPSNVLFADFNADGRPDMFLSTNGFDTSPFPGEQNRLYLSRPEGGWRDATENLPQLNDFTQPSAVGDISGRGIFDIFVSNGFARLDGNPVLPYTLLNSGSGQFTLSRTNIPAGHDQLLDPLFAHNFTGATLADLNGDGLPELIVTAVITANGKNRRTTILWNRAGVFVETDTTLLAVPEIFPDTRLDADVERLDVNQDGLTDLVLVGTQKTYSGWFLQIFINKGNRQFVDETADRMPPEDASGNAGAHPASLQMLDFNEDGAPDFSVAFRPQLNTPGFAGFPSGLPLIWLNDGAGHFSTLKVGDFVAAGRENTVFGGRPIS